MYAAQEPKFSVDAYAAGPNPFTQGGMGSFIGSGISFDFQVHSLKYLIFPQLNTYFSSHIMKLQHVPLVP
jgi:hypothetical protein